jgi:hypothetical protein
MTGRGWLDGLLAAVMVLAAAFCAVRLAVAKRRGCAADVGADGLHVLMGTAMAGMFAPRLDPIPAAAWQAVFAASAVFFAWWAIHRHMRGSSAAQGSRHAHPMPLAVESVAMVYMLLPAWPRLAGQQPGLTMSAMTAPSSGIRNPALALVLELFLLGYILWTTEEIAVRLPARLADQDAAATPRPLAPRLTGCTKIAMSAAMGYMLLLTL